MPRVKPKAPSKTHHHRPARRPTLADLKGPKPKAPSPVPVRAKNGSGKKSRIGFADYGTPGEKIETQKRSAAAVELRVMGATFQEIAEELGFASKGAAHDAFTRGYQTLTTEIQREAGEAIRHQLARNQSYRKRVLQAGNADGGSAAIAAVSVALKVDQFDAALRGIRPGDAANLDAVALPSPDGAAGGVCAKCGTAMTATPTDPKFELERIAKINEVLIESGAALVPLKVDEDGWEAPSAPVQPEQTAIVAQPPASFMGARAERIRDRELHDIVSAGFRDHEIL